MNTLYLEDLAGLTEEEVKEHIVLCYEAAQQEVDRFDILIAYESVGSWDCDSSSFFLLKEKETGKLFTNYGLHCSCHGFEDQFQPEETTVEFLKSDKFYVPTGDYDESGGTNKKLVQAWIKENL